MVTSMFSRVSLCEVCTSHTHKTIHLGVVWLHVARLVPGDKVRLNGVNDVHIEGGLGQVMMYYRSVTP